MVKTNRNLNYFKNYIFYLIKKGVIKNPFSLNTKKSEFIESESDFKLPTLDKPNKLSLKSTKSGENSKNKTA